MPLSELPFFHSSLRLAMFVPSTSMVVLASLCLSVCGQHRLCGPTLANTLSFVCKGRGFHVSHHAKRSPASLKTKELQHFLLKRTNEIVTKKRTVVDECCKQTCTFATLESYCADGPTMMPPRFFWMRPPPTTPPVQLQTQKTVTIPPPVVGRLSQNDFSRNWFFVTPSRRARFRIVGKRKHQQNQKEENLDLFDILSTKPTISPSNFNIRSKI